MRHRRVHREKLFVYHLWQTGDFMGWAVMTEAEAYIESAKCAEGQRWIKVEYFGFA